MREHACLYSPDGGKIDRVWGVDTVWGVDRHLSGVDKVVHGGTWPFELGPNKLGWKLRKYSNPLQQVFLESSLRK